MDSFYDSKSLNRGSNQQSMQTTYYATIVNQLHFKKQPAALPIVACWGMIAVA